MKMVKMFGVPLILSSLVYGGGDFGGITEYLANEEALAEEAYVSSYVEEPIVMVEEAYIEELPLVLKPKDEDIYMEPTVEGYVDPVLIEEEALYINSSSNLGNAISVYNGVEQVSTTDKTVKESTQTTSRQRNGLVSLNNRNGFYAGLGITALNYDIECACPNKSAKDTALGGITKVGYNLNRFLGIEARGMKINLKNSMGSVKHAGLFLKPMLPLGAVANAYSLIGIAQTTSSGEVRKIDTKSLALGAGMEFGTGKGLGAFVDYEKLVVKSGAPSLDSVSTGVSFGF